MLPVESPFKTYTDRDGTPLNGRVYFGVASANPITSPITVYWDADGTQPALQPLSVVNGYIVRAGTPANVFVGSAYSVLVHDSEGRQVSYARTSNDFSIAATVLNFIVSLALSGGSALVGFIAAGFGAVLWTVQGKLRETISVEDYLTAAEKADVAARTLLLDVSVNVQKAITAAIGRRLLWPNGALLCLKCLNASGRGSTSTIWQGQGFNTDMSSGTVIVGRTAVDGTLSPGWIADFTGSQNVTLQEMNFWGTGANASTKGLLFARTASVQFAQQILLDKICVKVETAPSATSIGSVAVVNNQAEQFKTDHCSFFSDAGFAGMLNNNLAVVSPFQVIDSSIFSTTAMQFSATTFYAYTQPSMVLWGVASANFDNSCVFARGPDNTTQYAIDLRAGGVAYNYPHCLDIKGQVEGFPGGVTFSSVGMSAFNVKTELFMVALNAAAVVTAANVSLYNCEFDNAHQQQLPGNVNLSCGVNNALYGGKIVCYPNDTGVAGSPAIFGTEISQDANGRGLRAVTVGVNVTSLAAPNASQTNITNDGFVCGSGILQSSAVIPAGNTIFTLDTIHIPDRTVYCPVFVSGVGLTYAVIAAVTGAVSLGVGLVNLSQVSLDSIYFKRVN